MGLLDRLFGSAESIAKEIAMDDDTITRHWNEYLDTTTSKLAIITTMSAQENHKSDLADKIRRLFDLLNQELVAIPSEEKEELELIADLEAMQHSNRIERVRKLERCLWYTETKHRYAYELLRQLHTILKTQMHIAIQLQKGSGHTNILLSHLTSQVCLEHEVLRQIDAIERKEKGKFHNLFLALVKGEHIIKTLDASEKRMLNRIQKGFNETCRGEIDSKITYDWIAEVDNRIKEKVYELIADRSLIEHPDVDVQFVNSPAFVEIVRDSAHYLKGKPASDRLVNVFTHLFREFYTHER